MSHCQYEDHGFSFFAEIQHMTSPKLHTQVCRTPSVNLNTHQSLSRSVYLSKSQQISVLCFQTTNYKTLHTPATTKHHSSRKWTCPDSMVNQYGLINVQPGTKRFKTLCLWVSNCSFSYYFLSLALLCIFHLIDHGMFY